MKKFFFIAAIASAALVSCTKNEVTPISQDQEITFAAPVVAPATKATNEVWNNYPQGTQYDFAVWAKYYVDSANPMTGTYDTWATGSTYMQEVKVSYGDNTWAPAQNYYWPKNGSLTFIAYAPAGKATADATATGITFTDYEVYPSVADQVDLLFSERAYNKQSVDDNTAGTGETNQNPAEIHDPYKGVHLAFKHALSSIAFNVKTAANYTGTTITLNKIELLDVVSKGSFNQNLADNNGAMTTAAAWTLSTDAADVIDYNVNNASDLSVVLDNEAYWTASASKTAPAVVAGLRVTDFILLPQALANVKLKVTYTLDNSGVGSEPLTQVIEKNLATTAVSTWEMGKRYVYNITLGLDTIYFEPYVAPWTDVTVTPSI